jgi:hypothetical protein
MAPRRAADIDPLGDVPILSSHFGRGKDGYGDQPGRQTLNLISGASLDSFANSSGRDTAGVRGDDEPRTRMRRRVAVARCLVNVVQVLLYDRVTHRNGDGHHSRRRCQMPRRRNDGAARRMRQ